MATETITLATASAIPPSVNVDEIAEKALQAAFSLIATELTAATGKETTGDFEPGETFALDRAFVLFVRAMALNNDAVVRDGDRVRLTHDVERYPHFIAPKGATGIVREDGPDLFVVKLDQALAGAEEWENEIHWSNGDDPGPDLERI
jgi:hypothetical protein